MAIDITKLKPEDLKKLAAAASKNTSAKASIARARKMHQAMAKDTKTLAEIAKANPDV